MPVEEKDKLLEEAKTSSLDIFLADALVHAVIQPKPEDKWQFYFPNPPVNNLPNLKTSYFTGREAEIEEIKKRFDGATYCQSISGISGSGKTQLALEYAFWEFDGYDYIWWIDCESENTVLSSYRTTNNDLLTVWDRVRKLDDAILEPLVKNGYVARLDESIFEHSDDDEIILCLNYDGLYGINNINRFLQNSNPNPTIVWGINTYKVGDPILFNESNIFSPLIHNNSKGRIVDIRPEEQQIWFKIELEESINEIDAWGYDFELIGESEAGKSIISFSVNRYRSTDEDDDDNDSTVVPFQVAYAVSIHKAQGLEYDSVKIVITNETEERITHNIFYTAITRAKNKLKIYWSPETEQSVLDRLEVKNSNKDAYLLAQLSSLAMS